MTPSEPSASVLSRRPSLLGSYLRIARPDHWIKNIFMVPGAAFAFVMAKPQPLTALGASLGALLLLCLAASANYTINEYLDAETDRFHPLKQSRPGALGILDARLVLTQYLLLAGLSLAGSALLGRAFLCTILALLLMGVCYNVPPLRTKDRIYLDVLSESINNPLRFLLGWFAIIADQLPPSSVLISYWMGGAFLMAMKRYSEYRRIADPAAAGAYRRSFQFYSEQSLLLSSFFYAICSALFLGVFLIKYRVELILAFPLLSVLFTWYLAIALRRDSAAQAPEKLYREGYFLAYVGFLFLFVTSLLFIDLPFLDRLITPLRY